MTLILRRLTENGCFPPKPLNAAFIWSAIRWTWRFRSLFHNGAGMDQAVSQINTSGYGLCSGKNTCFNQLRQRMGTWAEHAASWVDATGIDVHIMRYEDMKAKTVETFFKTIEFIGLKRTKEDVEKALELSDMNKLKKYEQEYGFVKNPRTQKAFSEKGKTGDWQDQLTQDQVKSIIHINGDVMKKFGYLD